MDDSMLIEILKEMQNKYQCIIEIERITREVGESLSRNDRTSVQLLLGMRQEEMDKADIHERNIKCLILALPSAEAAQVRDWLKGNNAHKPVSPVAEKLVERGKSFQLVMKRVVEMDRHISTRLAGKDSYYNH
ncbi:hypothetical protein [Lacrimispora indolis]|uniref:hypothetical protein n=1 Tax=Lacrimispora indolis TaxID=69825 RepID=UPI00041DFE8A|nr:hypothetical protein [[Clostridium] methoxybenzovorans]